MKKYNLFKVLAITIFVSWLLTLFIPGSYVDYNGTVNSNGIAGVGIWGLLSNLSISISYFNGIAVFLIALACFYAVLNKVDVYNAFVSKTATLFKEKKGLLVSITILVFGVISLFVSDYLVLLVFVPFIYKVMKELEIDKKVILSSTLVAGLIGSMCAIYNNTLFSAFSLELNTLLLVKVLLFAISISVLIVLTAPKNKVKKISLNSDSDVKKNVKEEKETSKKTSSIKKNQTKKVETKKSSTKVSVRKKVAK